ncbi:MAG: urease accessory protein UreD [Betaproteobacteria bacterium]|nr:MAG: urease accessory protein UreD [Betaproteobacteria bacterium]
MKPVEALLAAGWQATLELGFRADDERTWLARRRHSGPLLVQRSFYPEDARLCQMVIVHPPGGVAGGDELAIDIVAEERAGVQLTTPGAGKWYRGFGRHARQTVRIAVAAGAMCEWLPQESIIFDGASAQMSLRVDLADDAVFCGWDFTCLGRPQSDQHFFSGQLQQVTDIRRDGRPLFREQAGIGASNQFRAAPSCLAGNCSFGSMLVAGKPVSDDVIDAARGALSDYKKAGVTRLGDALVARWVGNSVEQGRKLFSGLWSVLRPWYARRAALPPRIWAT